MGWVFLGKFGIMWVLIVLILVSGHGDGCLEGERRGLLEFKNFLKYNGADADHLLPTWVDEKADHHSDCCDWERVTCDHTTGHVTELSLDSIKDVYYVDDTIWFINASLFLPFKELRSLNLNYDLFSGWTHNEGFERLSNLRKLEILDLGSNDFDDNNIFHSLGALTSIKTLIISDNALGGYFPAHELVALRNLETLDISTNGYHGCLPMQGFEKLSALRKLETLNLEWNQFDDSILPSLSALRSLKMLNLRANNIGGLFPPQELAYLGNLERLDLSVIQFNDIQGWRFATEKNSLWRKVLCAKNNVNEDCWLPIGSSFRSSSAVWKSISSMEMCGSRAAALFLENIQFKLGDGKRIKFWLDPWVSATPLSILYPRLFSLATSKGAFVHQYLSQAADNQPHWNISFRRTLRAWEDELHLELISRLPQPLSIYSNCEDHLLWTPSPSGSFTVKSLYELFESSLRLTPFPIMKMWKSAAPPKIKAFGWLVWWNRIASSDLLARRLIIPATNPCAFCGIVNESASHLLLQCTFAWKVWAEIIYWWGSPWVSPSSLQDLLLWWYGQKYKNLGKLIWEVIPLAVVWSLWIARNNLVFNSKVPIWGNIVDSIKIKVATWVKFSSHLPHYSIHDFIHCLDGLKDHKL